MWFTLILKKKNVQGNRDGRSGGGELQAQGCGSWWSASRNTRSHLERHRILQRMQRRMALSLLSSSLSTSMPRSSPTGSTSLIFPQRPEQGEAKINNNSRFYLALAGPCSQPQVQRGPNINEAQCILGQWYLETFSRYCRALWNGHQIQGQDCWKVKTLLG